MKVLHVRKIGIDVVPNEIPFIELRVDLHFVDVGTNKTAQVVSDYGRIYKKITELNPIPLTTEADDGVIDSTELMNLVAVASLQWVANDYNGTIDKYGRVIIK